MSVPPFQLEDVIKILSNIGVDTNCAACMEIAFTSMTTTNHTCELEMSFSREELQALDDYFVNRAGYISQEFDELVHRIIGRIGRVLRESN